MTSKTLSEPETFTVHINFTMPTWDIEPEEWTDEEIKMLKMLKDNSLKMNESAYIALWKKLCTTKTPTQQVLKAREIDTHITPVFNCANLNKVGTIRKMNNGLKAQLIRYSSADVIDVKFEDGFVICDSHTKFKHGKIIHPGLPVRGHGTFHGFKTKRIQHNYEYYEATCEKCGYKGILTPKQMMEHICQ